MSPFKIFCLSEVERTMFPTCTQSDRNIEEVEDSSNFLRLTGCGSPVANAFSINCLALDVRLDSPLKVKTQGISKPP